MIIKKYKNLNQRKRLVLGIILLFILLLTPLYFFVLAENNIDNKQQILSTISKHKQKEEINSIQKCFSLPEGRDSCYFNLCKKENPYLCAEELLESTVKISGPEQAMEALNDMMASSLFGIASGHQLAHIIGKTTSHHYGLNIEAFLRCTPDFNFGCQHGFFEDILTIQNDPVKVALEICESAPQKPYLDKFYCYHGMGHGFMLVASYHLKDALSLCDQLTTLQTQNACYEGVFMENEDGFSEGIRLEEMGFTEDDILAPCNRVNDKYRNECYGEHGVYIMQHSNLSIRDASLVCLEAEDYTQECINSLAVLAIAFGWHELLRGSFEGTPAETTAYLCSQFLPEYIEICQIIAISNMLNKDRTDIQMKMNAPDFCLAFQNNTSDCFKIIGAELFEFTQDHNEVIRGCNKVPEEYRDSCYEGGGITIR